jgi:hypothetical protein
MAMQQIGARASVPPYVLRAGISALEPDETLRFNIGKIFGGPLDKSISCQAGRLAMRVTTED